MKPRRIETNQGIQGEFNVTIYDQMQLRLRDKGWIETPAILKKGITSGLALEIGPGPGDKTVGLIYTSGGKNLRFSSNLLFLLKLEIMARHLLTCSPNGMF